MCYQIQRAGSEHAGEHVARRRGGGLEAIHPAFRWQGQARLARGHKRRSADGLEVA